MKKRLWSILLAVCLIASMLPTTVLAAEDGVPAPQTEPSNVISADTTWSEAKTLTENLTIKAGATLTVAAPVTVSGAVTISGGGTIKRADSYKNAILSVPESGTLTLENIIIDGGATWSEGTDDGLTADEAAIRVDGGQVTLNDGAVVQNNNHVSVRDNSYKHSNKPRYYNMGGGIAVYSGGTLTMNEGAEVRNNAVTNKEYAKGDQEGNSDSLGGGVAIYESGTFIMNGGKITGNRASVSGGNGRAFGGGVGLITRGPNNDASDARDNLKITVTMNGGTIRNNSAPGGGGIYGSVDQGDEKGDRHKHLEVNINGEISNNKSSGNGGGIQVSYTDLSIGSGAKIVSNEANEANTKGGGLYVGDSKAGYGSVRFSGEVTIQNNTAPSDGPNSYFSALGDVVFNGLSEQSKIGMTWAIEKVDAASGTTVVSGVTDADYSCIVYERRPNDWYVLRQKEDTVVLHKALHMILKATDPEAGSASLIDGLSHTVLALEGETVDFTKMCGFELTGYHIDRWAKNYEGQDGYVWENPHTFAQADDKQNANAIWLPNEYTIKYELNGGTAGENPPAKHIYATETQLVDPTRENYTFGGWFTSSDFSGTKITSLGAKEYTNDITLYALWTKTIGTDIYYVCPSIADQIYTGTEWTPSIKVIKNGTEITGGFTVEYSDNTNVGTATATVKVGDIVIGTATFKITKAVPALKITPDVASLRGNGTVTLTVMGAPIEGTVNVTCNDDSINVVDNRDGTFTVTLPNETKTYTFTAAYTAAENGNYTDAGPVTCTVSVTRYVPSAPGSSVSVPATANGSVTVSPSTASKGTTVTVTTKPNEGYELGSLEVLDKNGNALALKDLGGGKYSFTMPDGKVSVNASFVKASVSTGFADVPANAYYADAVKWAVDKGVTNGLSANLFGPYEPCTRAQIVTFLWRAAGSPEPKNTGSFADVSADSYYAKAVAWAVENGITSGTTDTTFSPDEACTREQAVAFLYRASGSPAVSSGSAFSDVAASAYYANAVAWAEKNGVTGGIGTGKFGTGSDCTRAQIVTFLFRAYQGK